MIYREELSIPNDPYAREFEIFPRLIPEMMACVIAYGSSVVASIHQHIATRDRLTEDWR